MSVYKYSNDRVYKRFFWWVAGAFGVTVLFGGYLLVWLGFRLEIESITDNWKLFLVLYLALATIFVVGFAVLHAFFIRVLAKDGIIEVGESYIVNRPSGFAFSVQKADIESIKEDKKGLIVIHNSGQMHVPVDLEGDGYEEVRSVLATWRPIESAGFWVRNKVLVLTVLYVLGYLVVLLSWSEWLALIVSLVMIVGIFTLYRSGPRRGKKLSVFEWLYLIGQLLTLFVVIIVKFLPLHRYYEDFVRSLWSWNF